MFTGAFEEVGQIELAHHRQRVHHHRQLSVLSPRRVHLCAPQRQLSVLAALSQQVFG